jgi:hypothetical protein
MLKKIQIFKAGKYGESSNRVWNDEEVKQLKDNYDFNFRRAMVKLGHDGFLENEKPAVGWVESLSINDKGILEANVNFIDDEVKNIKDKYINVSGNPSPARRGAPCAPATCGCCSSPPSAC